KEPPPHGISAPSLHDALPISGSRPVTATSESAQTNEAPIWGRTLGASSVKKFGHMKSSKSQANTQPPFEEIPGELTADRSARYRSEEHTSELQSRENLVCRLL